MPPGVPAGAPPPLSDDDDDDLQEEGESGDESPAVEEGERADSDHAEPALPSVRLNWKSVREK